MVDDHGIAGLSRALELLGFGFSDDAVFRGRCDKVLEVLRAVSDVGGGAGERSFRLVADADSTFRCGWCVSDSDVGDDGCVGRGRVSKDSQGAVAHQSHGNGCSGYATTVVDGDVVGGGEVKDVEDMFEVDLCRREDYVTFQSGADGSRAKGHECDRNELKKEEEEQGGDSVVGVKGKWYNHNKNKRLNKKLRAIRDSKDWRRSAAGENEEAGVERRKPATVSDENKLALRESLEAKWAAENKLARIKAEREIMRHEAVDTELMKKKELLRVRLQTERSMVAIEKTHATLKATGNVPDLPGGGYAETIVEEDGTISPNSSASMQEYRQCLKKNADLEAELEKKTKALENLSEKFGMDLSNAHLFDKNTWTDKSENHDILDDMYPDGYLECYQDAPEGKFRLRPTLIC